MSEEQEISEDSLEALRKGSYLGRMGIVELHREGALRCVSE